MASALPGFRGALERQRLTTTTNELLLAVNLARSEATARRTRAALAPRNGTNWASGWRVFLDANDNGHLDPDETILRTFDPVPAHMSVAATFGGFDGHVLSFDHAGLLRRPGSNGMVLGRLTLTADGQARTLCFSAASVRAVRGTACA
jgi:type IV fimbrial biogenesis protein FimT